MEKELPNTSNASKTKAVERESSIIRCYEIASDLTLLYLQKADRATNSSSGQSAGQSTWSVASAGTTGSTSPVQPPIGTMNGNLAVPGVGGQGLDDNQSIFAPKMGSILECALYRAAVLNINQGKPMKAVSRLRSMLMAEESESTQEIRQNVCCQLAEVLISNCSTTKYVRPDLDAMSQTKRSNRHTFNKDHAAKYGCGNVSGSSENDNPWKPLRQSVGRDMYVPKNKYEELVLILLLSEYIANKEAILSQGPASASGRKATFDSATVTYDLLTLPLSRFSNFRLLCDMLERSMKFSFQEKHTWEQFALVLTAEGRYFRSLLVYREIAERLKKGKDKMMDVGSFLSAARLCYERLGLYEEGILWATRALESEEARDNNYMSARANVFVGIGHLISARSVENLTDRKKRITKAGQCFEHARQRDDQDHFAEFYLAYYYAQTRQIKKATLHVRNALSLHSYHLPSLHLMILLLSCSQDYAEALELTEQTMEEYPDHLGIMTLKIKLQEMMHGTEIALLSAKEMMQHWQIMVEEIQQNVEEIANLNSSTGNEIGTFNVGQYLNMTQPGAASQIAPATSLGGLGIASTAASVQLDYGTIRSSGGMGAGGPSHFDTLSDKDSISLHAHSVTASHVEKTLSEVASSFSFQMPQKPNPNDPSYSLMRIWLLIAELHLGQDNIVAAELCATEARSLSPLSYHLTHVRGLIFEAKGEYEEARQCYENALAVNPSHVQSLQHLASVYFKLGFLRLAEQTLNLALRTEPNSENLWSLLGEVTEALGDEMSDEAYQWENTLEESELLKGKNVNRIGRSDNESTDEEINDLDDNRESPDEDDVDNVALNVEGRQVAFSGRDNVDQRRHSKQRYNANVRNRPKRLGDKKFWGNIDPSINGPDNLDFFCVAEDESTPTNETVGSFANEAAKMFTKAAECQAVALSIENSSPILPFSTISLAFE